MERQAASELSVSDFVELAELRRINTEITSIRDVIRLVQTLFGFTVVENQARRIKNKSINGETFGASASYVSLNSFLLEKRVVDLLVAFQLFHRMTYVKFLYDG